MKTPVWLSFDLGLKGDYEGIYAWLDNHGARECGDSVAYFHYDYERDLVQEMKEDLEKNVNLESRNRVYIVWSKGGKSTGRFLFGNRKAAPWAGHGVQEPAVDEEG